MNDNLNENNAINPSINEKKTQTFNLIIGIATLLIAIFGATFAYFTATARSREGEVTVKSAMVSINFENGTEVTAQNLIPSSEDIMLYHYQQKTQVAHNPEVDGPFLKEFDDFLEDDDQSTISDYADRRCIDSKYKEVCSVYWFSVTNEGTDPVDIVAYINIEDNEFQNLSYLIYKVDYQMDESAGIVRDKYGHGLVDSYNPVGDFSYNNVTLRGNETIPYGMFKPEVEILEDDEVVGTTYPVACMFGEKSDVEGIDIDNSARCDSDTLAAGSNGEQFKQYYEIVIWLEETGTEQLEQGKSFNGTLSVEVVGSTGADGYENGHITGRRD